MSLNLLAIDTSSDACTVAVLANNAIFEQFQLAPRQHNALILPMIEQVLAEGGLRLNQLDAIAFGCGPGSFTGLRIAAGVVQGIAFAADLSVIPISTLHALAQGAWREQAVQQAIVAIDARINEIYWSAFQLDASQLMQPLMAETMCAPDELTFAQAGQWQGIGSGWDAYSAILQQRVVNHLQGWQSKCYVKAQDILTLAVPAYYKGKAVAAAEAIPVYIRDQVVREKPHG